MVDVLELISPPVVDYWIYHEFTIPNHLGEMGGIVASYSRPTVEWDFQDQSVGTCPVKFGGISKKHDPSTGFSMFQSSSLENGHDQCHKCHGLRWWNHLFSDTVKHGRLKNRSLRGFITQCHVKTIPKDLPVQVDGNPPNLVMTNRASHGFSMALIEIDGLPSYKNGWIFYSELLNNQRVWKMGFTTSFLASHIWGQF